MQNDDTDDEPADDDVIVFKGAAGFKKFCEKMREVTGSFGAAVEPWQVESLAKERCTPDEDGNQTMAYGEMKKLRQAIVDFGLSNTLSELVSAGVLDCAWDSDANEFLFRLSDEAQEKYKHELH